MNDQAASLRRKVSGYRMTKQAKTIAVASGKGGVGKSNFTLNFSLALTDRGYKVLIIDLDIGMGNIDILLGKTAHSSIINMFEKQLSIFQVIEQGPNGISYISAGSGLSEIFNLDNRKLQFFLEQLNELLQAYDYILFDMGAGVTAESFSFMQAADECIVVTVPEPTALTDAYGLIKHLSASSKTSRILLLVNRAPNQKAGRQTMDRLTGVARQFLNKEVVPFGILPEDRTVSDAVSSQTPFVLRTPKAAVSLSLNEILDQYLTDRIDIDKKAPHSFLARLKTFLKER